MLLLCTACTSGGGAGPSAVPPPGATSAGAGTPRVLRVATASDVSIGPVRERLIEAWDRQRDDYTVEIVKLPAAADEVRSQLIAALQSGSADYDVVNIDVTWTAEFAAGGLIRPLAGELPEDIWPSVAATTRYDGRTWAVPFNTDAALLYYRTDIWRDRDWRPPRTWAELEEDVAEARDPERVTRRFEDGYITQLGPYEGLTVNALEAVWARGGRFVGEDGEVTADSVEVRYGLDNLYRQYRDLMPRALARRADEHDSLAAFRDGKVPFMRNWPYVYNILAAEGSRLKGRFGVVALPGQGDGKPGTSVLGGQNLAITTRSEHSAAARELLAYLTEPAQQRCLLDVGFAPVLRSSYDPSGDPVRCSLPPDGDGGADAPGDPEHPAGGTDGGTDSGSADGGNGDGGDRDGPAGTGGSAGRGRAADRTADAEPAAGADGAAGESGAAAPDPGRLPVYAAPLRQALAAARPRPVTPYYAAFTELIQSEVHAMLLHGGNRDALPRRLAEQLGPVLRGG
ncbi:extracellular solute-binding protein [Streptomyces pactum]|uniref:Extracellular solute-binding protein n=1 Tax=Streptomyces pactum TaxID=68249 RepID=A0ABS0NJF0_9ACTN|nr:extracellular solute-binding protein [Streptomyces pactum]